MSNSSGTHRLGKPTLWVFQNWRFASQEGGALSQEQLAPAQGLAHGRESTALAS